MKRMKPYTATFSITPDMSAETWDGAAGCASGSQACSGTSPALVPKPRKASPKATLDHTGCSSPARIASKVKPCPKAASTP